MVSNAQNYTALDWADEIRLAQAAHIDAFALNTAFNQGDGPQYDLAFAAAAAAGFQLFVSFDYAGNGAWPLSQVIQILQNYKGSRAHYRYNGKAFVSTFEGPEAAEDWVTIKQAIDCFSVPDWSSVGAKAALELQDGVADALFSWAAWPWGDRDMNKFVDASYLSYLGKRPYMMPVSPWFYTNLPGFNKNWLWRGDSLWADRWIQVQYLQPEWVEIISWNDYGESHYVGPIRDKAMSAMTIGRAPFDYVADMPHDGFRELLPFAADLYKNNQSTVTQEKLVYWYRKMPAAACASGHTTGNTALQLQYEIPPTQVAQDRVFFTAILSSNADVSVSIGGVTGAAKWTDVPNDNVGQYHGSVEFGGRSGPVVIAISRSGRQILSSTGVAIGSGCEAGGMQNWNVWVGSASGSAAVSRAATSLTANSGGGGGTPVYIDPAIWTEPTPIVSCIPPCVVVLPPYLVPTTTTITFPPFETTFTESCKDGSATTTVVTATFAPVTTTKIPVFNLNITASGVDKVTYKVTPSILPTAHVTLSCDNTAIPIFITSTPGAEGSTKTYPPISNKPTQVSFTSTTPPGPTCTSSAEECGEVCIINCISCGIFGCGGTCPGCGGDWSMEGGESETGPCVGPKCPTNTEAGYDTEENDPCQPDVVTSTGLCSNGNYPIWNPVTSSVSCEYSAEHAPRVMTSCQAEIDKDLANSVDLAGQSSKCCPLAKRSVLDIFSVLGNRQGPKNCGPDPDYPNNPPAGGKNYHEVFECDYDKWPNACANAQSAIVSRGKSPIMTYSGPGGRIGAMKEVTKPWYFGKWESGPSPQKDKQGKPLKTYGWGLTGCQVEEYPWGAGAPNRNPNIKKWDEQSVLRLIPQTENGDHGNALKAFITKTGNANIEQAKGLIFSVSFVGSSKLIGTSDADFYVDPSKRAEAEAKNICAIPYGVHFLFVNYAPMSPGERNYDPWWDDKLFKKTVNILTDKNGVTLATQVVKTVSNYCQYPSPGKLSWNADNNKWEKWSPATSFDRQRGNKYYKCDNYPGYSGPKGMKKFRRRGHRSLDDLAGEENQDWQESGLNITSTLSNGTVQYLQNIWEEEKEVDTTDSPWHSGEDDMAVTESLDVDASSQEVSLSPRAPGPGLASRWLSVERAAAGSFLDASAFLYLGCGNDSGDECAGPGVECGPTDFEKPQTTTTSTKTSTTTTKSTTAPPPPATTTASTDPPLIADCGFWDVGWGWQFEVYNIFGWGTDDGGKGLHDNENGCGGLTGWTWNDPKGTYGAKAWFNLPFFFKAGCVERAIVSAGGPKLECEYQGWGKVKRIGPADGEMEEIPVDAQTPTKQVVEASPTPLANVIPYVYNGTTQYPEHDLYQPMEWSDPGASASMATALPSVSVTAVRYKKTLPY
ncbi:alpha-1,3-glucanase [Diaporthe helianthi]|uniref:Alpha-1,3-glucanase n=1 Tax=Diaporthe helianthi TaxID=158607 RepID=A0A2P5HMD6_DIAHE|nr:alpha-1,3-glucanase [Diaporthe helianthi]